MAVLVVVVGWVVYSLSQELFLAQRLNAEAGRIRRENAALQADNSGYQRDIQAGSSGSRAAENARRAGYARPGERRFAISDPPTPTPTPRR